MPEPPGRHEFDASRAATFEPVTSHIKTAILVDVVDDGAPTVLRAPFGEQTLLGPFYIVAEGDGSYGAARAEFEQTHEKVGPCQWRKSEAVLAYQVQSRCLVDTRVAGHHEASVIAQPGDWIVQQHTGEVMVITADAFAARYAPDARAR